MGNKESITIVNNRRILLTHRPLSHPIVCLLCDGRRKLLRSLFVLYAELNCAQANLPKVFSSPLFSSYLIANFLRLGWAHFWLGGSGITPKRSVSKKCNARFCNLTKSLSFLIISPQKGGGVSKAIFITRTTYTSQHQSRDHIAIIIIMLWGRSSRCMCTTTEGINLVSLLLLLCLYAHVPQSPVHVGLTVAISPAHAVR